MSKLTPSLSRVLKPYHTHELQYEEAPPTLDSDGFLAFSPGDVENPKTWSRARRWWVSFAAVLMVVNATFASSTPSGVLLVSFCPAVPPVSCCPWPLRGPEAWGQKTVAWLTCGYREYRTSLVSRDRLLA